MLEPIRILVLEDDDTMRSLLGEVLESHGYRVETAALGAEAVEKARRHPFDLVVVDVRMEGMDGLEALVRMRENQPDLRSLVVTGYSTEADSIRAIRLGVGDYLKKPFPMETFLDSVGRLVARRRQEQQLAAREAALRQTAVWAMESVARSVELSRGGDGTELVERGRRARQAASVLGLPEEDVQTALLAAALREGGASLPEFFWEGLSTAVQRLLRQVERPESAELSLDARLVRALLNRPGEVPPEIAQTLQRLTEGPVAGSPARAAPIDGERRRGLLSLGRALEEAGQLPSAGQAFEEILQSAPLSRETVEAALGQARLAALAGQPQRAGALARQAWEAARRLGPELTAWTGLEAAFLVGAGEEPARLALEAAQLFSDMGMPAGEARARLALCCLGGGEEGVVERALPLLLRPEHLPELEASAGWLLPFLLERQGGRPEAATARALHQLVGTFPRKLHRLLSSGRLSAAGRRAASGCLGAAGPWRQECLRELAGDPDPEVRRAAEQALGERPQGPPVLRLCSLGPFEVRMGDERITEWRSQKVRYLLACLASHAGRPASEDTLIEAFWPENAVTGRKNLTSALSVLRSVLRLGDGAGELNHLVREGTGVSLNAALPRWHDLEEFDRALAEAFRQEAARNLELALDRYRQAVRLYRGPYLEGCYMEWALLVRTRLERQVIRALESLATHTARQARPQESLEYAQRLLELDPCHQGAWLAAMQSQLALGRPEEAVRQFESCQRILARELALEPSIDLLRAHEQALLNLSSTPAVPG